MLARNGTPRGRNLLRGCFFMVVLVVVLVVVFVVVSWVVSWVVLPLNSFKNSAFIPIIALV